MRTLTRTFTIFLLVVLAGCATLAPDEAKVVKVPVAVACMPADTPDPPKLREAEDLRRMDPGDFVLAIGEERARLRAWAEKISAYLHGCRVQPK